MINGLAVEIEKNENGHYRGLHIVIINHETAEVVSAKVFDTHQSTASFDTFLGSKVPSNHIVVAACKDDCDTELSDIGR